MMINVINDNDGNDDDGNDDDGNGDDDEDDGRNVERLGDSRRLQRHQLTFWALVPNRVVLILFFVFLYLHI